MPSTPTAVRAAICIEETLGHRTHGQNLERSFQLARMNVDFHRIEYPLVPDEVPWAARASVSALRRLRAAPRYGVTMFHTQTTALLAPEATRGEPFVISMDATPTQMDAMGEWYNHPRQPGIVERAKRGLYRRVLRQAAGVVTWSRWTADSAERDYGIAADRITVLHPGAPDAYFALPRRACRRSGPVRILFVGGDFARKGGPALIEAFRPLADRAELTVITQEPLPPEPGLRVVNGVIPGSDELLRAYADANLFCLPTLGDCTAVVLGEAMAAGLPVVTTAIASNPEWVPPEAGILVAPGDGAALHEALRTLVDDGALRERMSVAARTHAAAGMHAERNAVRLAQLLAQVAS